MALKDWGLTPARIAALTPAELADYEAAIAEYDAAARDSRVPWAYMSGLPAPPSAEGIRAIARTIRAGAGDERSPPTGVF
ncbi:MULTISPECIES: hypothetical protein [unclassified Microbacterium]|uniref:hypothetical protein n=1 Tax=unclassified Microbacterium TaxID=2609290 RepID=UPI003015A810